MASIIKPDFFVGEITLPNTSNQEVQERLVHFIDKYEERFLNELFGYELYKAYKSEVSDPGAIPAGRWADIFSGKEYQKNSKNYKWAGLVKGKQSPIANYIYFFWMSDAVSVTSQMGETVPQSENSQVITPAVKMCRAWNEMSDQVLGFYDFMEQSKTSYPEWEHQDKWGLKKSFRKISEFGI